MKPEQYPPSAKSKDDVARISNVLVESAVFDETLRLERFSIGIDFLVASHAPVNSIWVSTLTCLADARELTIY